MKRTLSPPRFRCRAGCWLLHPGWRLAGLALIAGALGLAPAHAADEDSNDGPVRFHDVKGWRGTLVATARPSKMALDLMGSTLTGKGVKWNLDYTVYVNVEFVLTDYESDPSVWKGRVERADYSSGYRWATQSSGGKTECVFNSEGPLDFSGDARVELQFHRQRGWSVRMPSGRRTTELREKWTSPEGKVFPSSFTGHTYGMGSTKTHPYPKQGFILFASDETKEGSFAGVGGSMTATPALTWDYTIYLEPTSMTELRLEFEDTAAYREWRPDAKPDGGPGTPLEIKATLVAADGSRPKADIKSFVWELTGTSTEPGIAMNYPVNPQDFDYDLELEATGPMSVLDNAKQRVTRAVRSGFSDTVKIVPRDWGGWATLQATAILTDGRRVQGKLKGKKETGLRLPKRAADSKIADSWKERNKSGADSLDDEDEPVGDGNKGDGFTLYEEYRGFIVEGQHVEGDPKKKDFFVLNLIGGDAEPGIDLFASLSQLRVHSRLRPEEMSETTRLMNGNNSQGAHRVDQHGVWVKTFSKATLGDTGAQTPMTEAGVAGRPGITKGIGILARDDTESAFNQPFNLPPSDTTFAYDRAIAHELLHSVGAEHHGSGDYRQIMGYCSPRHPLNKLGRPYYGYSADAPIILLDEDGQDVAAKDFPDYVKFREFIDMMMLDRYLKEGQDYITRNGVGYSGFNTPQQYADFHIELLLVFPFMSLDGTVGVERGEHSGHQDCVMRYSFAKFYEAKAAAQKTLYVVTPGTERIGLQLCQAAAGTGINSPGRRPQSRYGDAGAGGGNCAAQICPNDAIPPRKVKP